KQGGQLAAKMRLMAAPLLGLIETGAWLRNARHANQSAAVLETRLAAAGIPLVFPRQANAVFIHLTEVEASALRQRGWPFYISDCHGAARFMCGWDTTLERIEALAADLKACRAT
ncbi:MAG: hypothetical protein ACKN9W_15615, partial [Methylococcus sp.]